MTKTNGGLVQIVAYVKPDFKAKLLRIAESEGRTVSQTIIYLLKLAIDLYDFKD